MLYDQLAQRLCNVLGLDKSANNNFSISKPITSDEMLILKPQIEQLAKQQKKEAIEASQIIEQLAQASAYIEPHALSHFIAGNVFVFQEQPLLALAHYAKAEQLYRLQNNMLAIARMTVGKVSAYRQNNDYINAVEAGKWALNILANSPALENQYQWANLNNALAIVYEYMGNYVEALESYECKRGWWQEKIGLRPDAEIQVARTLQNLGVVRGKLGQYIDAIEAFRSAKHVLETESHATRFANDLVRIEMNIAWVETLRDSPAPIIHEAFDLARQRRALLDLPDASTEFVLLDLYEFSWQLRHPEIPISPDVLTQLRAISQRCAIAGIGWERWYTDLLIGQIYFRQQQFNCAQALFSDIAHTALNANDEVISYQANLWLAKTLNAIKQPKLAQQILEQTLDRVEKVRGQLNEDHYRAGYLDDKLLAYQDLQQILIQQEQIRAAFNICERAKSRTLADMLQQIHENSGEINAPIEGYQQIDIIRLQTSLPVDTVAVSYSILHDEIFAYVLCAGHTLGTPLHLGKLPTLDTIHTDLAIIASISTLANSQKSRWLKAKTRAAQKPLSEWYDLLIRPIAGWLMDNNLLNTHKKWVISADGRLHLLPFSAFYDTLRQQYFIEEAEILHIPSFSTWALLPAYQQTDPNRLHATIVGISAQGALPHAVHEARHMAQYFVQASLFTETGVTHAAIGRAMRDADVIYFATHGVYRPDAPAQSYLELADGRLLASEILQMRLRAACVILSACETGVGTLSGNELMGLIRAFLYAGAKSVLATHWVTDDEATFQLMSSWMKHCHMNTTFSQALQKAKCELIARKNELTITDCLFSHPFYWGAISFTGRFGKFGK